MSFYNTPFTLLKSMSHVPFGSSVVVVSDSQYKDYQRKEAEREIQLLQSRAKAYRNTADLIDEEIKDIQKQAGLEPLQMQQELPN